MSIVKVRFWKFIEWCAENVWRTIVLGFCVWAVIASFIPYSDETLQIFIEGLAENGYVCSKGEE